jgi:hypothetical protein
MTATAEHNLVTVPGLYDISADQYHGDPVPGGSLSSSGARRLLDTCPAIYRWETDHPEAEVHKQVFDFGHAAHQMVLGAGPELAVIDAKDWRTNDAKAFKADAYAAGLVPLLAAEHEQVKAMAAALVADPVCAALLDPQWGVAEQSLFWRDDEYEVWRRARLDWFSTRPGRRPLVVDYKSADSVDSRSLQRAIHNHGYHQQQPYYLDGVHALGLAGDAAFVFLFQMRKPPYLVHLVQLKPTAVRLGRERNTAALETFRDCQASGLWPGYATDVTEIGLPGYAEAQWAADQFGEDR